MNYKIILEMGLIMMENKEKLKRAIEQDINPKNYYKKIKCKIEKGEKQNLKKYIWKWSLVPICLVIVISGVLFLNYQNSHIIILKNKPYIDKENNIILNINEVRENKVSQRLIDAEVKTVTNHDVNFPLPYKNETVDLPKDLDTTYKYILYFRENTKSKEYNIVGNYEIAYTNDNNRSIHVKYSKEHKPVRDYYFDEEGSTTTIINGIELKIYKFEDIYFTEFIFNDYSYDIETFKITEQELSLFLLSILK